MRLKQYVIDNDLVSVVARIERRNATREEVIEAGLRILVRKSRRAKWRHDSGPVYTFSGHEIVIPIGSDDSLTGYVINAEFDFWAAEVSVYPKYGGPCRMASTLPGGSSTHRFTVIPPMTEQGVKEFVNGELLADIKRVAAHELIAVANFHIAAAQEVLK